MKNFKIVFMFTAFLAVGLTFSSCGESAETAKTGKEYTSAFICPMHCEGSGNATMGKCPKCGMDYVANKNHKGNHDAHNHDGHNHDSHEGHNHGDHEGHNH